MKHLPVEPPCKVSSVQVKLDGLLLAILSKFCSECNGTRTLYDQKTSTCDLERLIKDAIAQIAHQTARATIAGLDVADRDVLESISASYGLTSTALVRRTIVDFHFGILNVFSTEDACAIMTYNSSSQMDMRSAYKLAETTDDLTIHPQMKTWLVPPKVPLEALSKLQYVIAVNSQPVEALQTSSNGRVEIPYDVIDFNHRSKGRFSAYQYVILYTALKDAGIEVEPSSEVFMGSDAMVGLRYKHAERVYKSIRIDRETSNGSVPKTIDIEWFEAIFASDNQSAMSDVLQDIEADIWFMNFFRSEETVPQYSNLCQDRADIFALLTALQGHPLEEVRSRGIVLLNAFLDDHEWQLYFPLIPRATNLGDEFTIKFAIELPVAEDITTDEFCLDKPPMEPKGVHMQLCAPPRDTNLPTNHGYLSYHRVSKWRYCGASRGVHNWEGEVTLGAYTRCGFYDWRVLISDVNLGSWEVAMLNMDKNANFGDIPWLKNARKENNGQCSKVFNINSRVPSGPVQGRFICQKANTNSNVYEYSVDSTHDERYGFSAMNLIEAIRNNENAQPENKFNTICVRGALDRKNRGVPGLSHVSLAQSMKDLKEEAVAQGIDVCVEASFSVDTANYDRKYNDYVVFGLEKGRKVQVYGAEGASERLEDRCLLNYRDARVWNLFLSDVKEWFAADAATGVVVEGLGIGPPCFSVDVAEMWKLDSDHMPHYSDNERLLGKVVLPLVVDSRCNGTASWPDPFSVFVCRGLWAVAPFAKVIGESALVGSMDQLSRSGVIPYVRSFLPFVSSLLNTKQVPDAAMIKADMSLWRKLDQRVFADSLHQLIASITNQTIPGSTVIVSSVSPGALSSYAFLEGKAWPYVAWLTLLPIQLAFSSNELTANPLANDAENNTTYRLPYVLKDECEATADTPSTPISNDYSRARSYVGNVRSGAQNPHSPTAAKSSSSFRTGRSSIMELKKNSFIHKSNIVTSNDLIGKIKKSVEVNSVASPNTTVSVDCLRSMAAIGLDTDRFYMHVEACVKRGRSLDSLLGVDITGERLEQLYVPMKPSVELPNVVCFARVVGNGSFAICAVNFGNEPQVVSMALTPLHHLLMSFNVPKHSNYVVQFIGENGPQSEDVCTLLESVTMDVAFTIGVGESALRIYSIQPQSLKLSKKELYRFAFHRLVQCTKDTQRAVRRGDKDACATIARSLNSNALIVDLINGLQEKKSTFLFAKYLLETSTVVNDLYSTDGGSRFLATLLDLGIFSTQSALPIDDALKTGSATSLAKTFSQKVSSLAISDCGEETSMQPVIDLAKMFTTSNGLGPIVFCTSEYGKYSTVGGLGVMIDELASTLVKAYNQEVWVISPYYHRNTKGRENNFTADGVEYVQNVGVQVGPDYVEFGLHESLHKGVRSFFIHHEGMFPSPYPDNKGEQQIRLLTFISKAMLETICFLMGRGERIPEMVVTNDWPTGLVPAHAKSSFGDTFRGTTFYHMVHNLDPSYEGRVWCDKDLYYIHGLHTELLVAPEWQKTVYNPSRCALLSCDSWGTVSPSYRNELLGIGCQSSSPLQSILSRCHDSFATPNGVPIEERENIILEKMKSCDLIPQNYEVSNQTQWLELHMRAKEFLQKRYFGFEEPDHSIPICAFVGRVTSQKGVHLIAQGAEHLIKRYNYRIQFLVGGMVNWSDPYSAGCGRLMLELRDKYPFCFWCGPDDFFYDGAIVNVGADIALMPSAFEPGGIVQHEFFSGGTPVLAFKTGGLRDTVTEFQPEHGTGSGWTFEAFNQGDYLYACERAVRVFNDKPKYDRLRINAKQATISSTEVSGKWLAEFTRIRRKFNVPSVTDAKPMDIELFSSWYEDQVECEQEISTVAPDQSPDCGAILSSRCSSPVAASAKIRYTPEGQSRPRNVAVSGGWNDWMVRHPMVFDPSTGSFFVSIQGNRGTWPYKIIRDGEWILNPHEDTQKDDEGNYNSVLYI